MLNLILNEKDYAERLISGETKDSNIYFALSIMARYYYHSSGFRRKRIATLLNKYVDDNYVMDNSERITCADVIEKIAANAKKYRLHEITGVGITSKEMATIDGIPGSAMRRIAFAILCLAKLGNLRNPNNNSWVNASAVDVFKLANVTCSSLERERKIGTLYKDGYIEFAKRNDNLSYRVKYVDEKKEEVMFVEDFRELGYQYLNYHYGGFVQCRECGIWMRGTNHKRNIGRPKSVYCKNCIAPHPEPMKAIKCQDCGMQFVVSNKNNRSTRCPHCYKLYRREYYKLNKRNCRNATGLSTIQN